MSYLDMINKLNILRVVTTDNFGEYLAIMCILKKVNIPDVVKTIKNNPTEFEDIIIDNITVNPSPQLDKNKKALQQARQKLENCNKSFAEHWEFIINYLNHNFCKVLLYKTTLSKNIATMRDYTVKLKELGFKYKITSEMEHKVGESTLSDIPCFTYISWISRKSQDNKRIEQIKKVQAEVQQSKD